MISIIIPTYNRKAYLEEAIRSIISQRNVKTEIIIIDDASTDNTADYVKKLCLNNVKYHRNNKNLFAHGSRLEGLKYVTGNAVIFMDDDDFYIDNNFLEKAEAKLLADESLSVVIGSTIQYSNGEYKLQTKLGGCGKISSIEYLNNFSIKYKKPMSTLSAVFRTSSLEECNIDKFRMVNDTCIYLLGIIQGAVYLIDDAVAAYRIHGNNISASKFKISFIKDCLEAKKEIYLIANKKEILYNPKKWFGNQISESAFYFIVSSNRNFIICFYVSIWICLRANGARIIILAEAIRRIKNKYTK